MKKGFLCLLLLMSMILAVPAYAASARTIDVVPDIEFNGTTATCTVRIMGDRTTDVISASVVLRQGSALIATWNASGSGVLKIDETAQVVRNQTYNLTVYYSINGVAQTPVSISRTNQ